ncbi:hypothetical protein J2W49_004311 [Hydrogenophaga palleronii]|uniref:Uncharacterized protein n=1 Tax=Hydrogenophaga palleronii TaxID=65655 RepID=A0ABU1WSQ8_9BURK|nr:hypothetical protein [Hydrogenophaga palleronii]MDR7152335.1 hypothetical protein [Hydrogenophaga palleronii]
MQTALDASASSQMDAWLEGSSDKLDEPAAIAYSALVASIIDRHMPMDKGDTATAGGFSLDSSLPGQAWT